MCPVLTSFFDPLPHLPHPSQLNEVVMAAEILSGAEGEDPELERALALSLMENADHELSRPASRNGDADVVMTDADGAGEGEAADGEAGVLRTVSPAAPKVSSA